MAARRSPRACASEGYEGPLTLVTAESDIPYQRPPLSKAFLKDTAHDLLPLRPASFYEKNHVTLMLGDRGGRDRSASRERSR